MERLTYRLGNNYGLEDKASSKVGLFTDYDGFFAYHVAVDQLGKYEDTGLTPEQILKLKNQFMELPCKIDDIVWTVWGRRGTKNTYLKKSIITRENIIYYVKKIENGQSFLSKEAAMKVIEGGAM